MFDATCQALVEEIIGNGRAELIRDGKNVAILTCGHLLREADRAARLLEDKSLSVRLLNLRSLQPIDETAVLNAATQTKILVTIEDHFLTGGLSTIVSELLARNRVACDLLPISLEGRWFKPALFDEVLRHEGFTGPLLADRILKRLRR